VRADLGTKEALDRILGSVAEFAGDRPQEDDMTAVLLKRTF
jgi:serine phosphatase RsbU (regulator of sigma subunit)